MQIPVASLLQASVEATTRDGFSRIRAEIHTLAGELVAGIDRHGFGTSIAWRTGVSFDASYHLAPLLFEPASNTVFRGLLSDPRTGIDRQYPMADTLRQLRAERVEYGHFHTTWGTLEWQPRDWTGLDLKASWNLLRPESGKQVASLIARTAIPDVATNAGRIVTFADALGKVIQDPIAVFRPGQGRDVGHRPM